MPRFTASERRGTILLLLIAAILILIIFLSRNPFSTTPINLPEQTDIHTGASDADTTTAPEQKNRKAIGKKETGSKKPAQQGRERNFLSEPL